ncbi:DUF2742 domain-containing protein [Mycobacterium canetti]|uniref:DUF2742 domain-containing protein n=1 Tax=Mycobacterium canetti TaxID=78331 RepID=UPI001E5671B6|nr:DUF2742 domain-containing protein [Mycobacterium canetti]
MNQPTASRTVQWWPVHLFVVPLLEEVGSWPLVGSLTWQQLPDDHPAKTAAVYDGARHHALRIETAQTALAEASQAISGAQDWPALSRDIRRRSGIYIPREVA